MADSGYAVVSFHNADGVGVPGPDGEPIASTWQCEPLPSSVLEDLATLLSALRAQPPDRGPFVVAEVDDEFFVIARLRNGRTELLLSDLTASVDYPLAAQVLVELGEDPPDDDELDEVWPLGDLDIFDDLGLGEDEMESIVDDLDAYADEMIEAITDRLGIAPQFAAASSRGR